MKTIIVVSWALLSLTIMDALFRMMNESNTVSFIFGFVFLLVLITISCKMKFGIKPYNYLTTKTYNLKTKIKNKSV